jgi:penicillin-binding protein 1A
MSRLTAGVTVIALIAAACSISPIEDPGTGAGSLSTRVYAADGSVLADWHAGEHRVLVIYDDLPLHLIDAVVAIEDRRFWVHSGVDVRALARAAGENYEAGEIVQGGSTITQQYARTVLLDSEVTAERKAREMGLALQLEETLTKQEILERYLNTVYFGEMAYGVGAAALRYFGKHVSELTLAESALLAGLIVAPSALNPYDHPDDALRRREMVLGEMLDLGWIDPYSAISASVTPLQLAPRGAADRMRFPYFTDEVRRRLLEDPALGATAEERRHMLTEGGLRIHTTLEPRVQLAAESALASVLPSGGPSGALVAVDPRNGHVLAIVGGTDFYDPNDATAQFNLATQGRRQPGSAFKPFALAAALEAGMALDSAWPGGRLAHLHSGGGTWQVRNHEDAFYPGLTLLEATVFSVNVPYAHLVGRVGAEAVVDAARAAGITQPMSAVPSIVLGSQAVSPFEMAAAYATFANEGIRVDPVLVTRIETADGTLLYEHVPTFTRAFVDEAARDVTAALTEAVRRGTGQHARIGRPVAGKSGTTDGNHDAWFVGYTPELSAAVWVGFPEGNRALVAPDTPFTITGGTWPAQIWARFAITALSGVAYSPAVSTAIDGLVTVSIDLSTGFVAGPLCPRSMVADVRVDPASAPTIVCPIHNPRGLGALSDGMVPDVVAFTTLDAVSLIEASGYRVGISWDLASPGVPGTVARQSPGSGTRLDPGSVVTIVVAGPEPMTIVPGVVGWSRDDAVTGLTALGMAVRVVAAPEPGQDTPEPGVVWGQRPAAGAPVEATVTVWVNP